MPLYEYECKKCGHRFEKIVKFSDKPTKKCPECGGAVEQTISAPAVQFKGSGWYVTDYAKKGSGSVTSGSDDGGGAKDAAKDSKDAAKETTASKETKKDEKPKAEAGSSKKKKE